MSFPLPLSETGLPPFGCSISPRQVARSAHDNFCRLVPSKSWNRIFVVLPTNQLSLKQAHEIAHHAEAHLLTDLHRLTGVTIHTSPAGLHQHSAV